MKNLRRELPKAAMRHARRIAKIVKEPYILWLVSLFIANQGVTQSLFQEITAQAGIEKQIGSEGIAVGDFNNDGLEDIYVSFLTGDNQLYKNQGDGTFLEMATNAGVSIPHRTKTAVWGDFNNDGWLDIYVGNQRAPDQLFLNKGDETFEEITEAANIYNFNLPQSVNLADVNKDGFLDIYISNFEAQNILYLNNQDLTFTDYTLQSGALDDGKSMGSIFFDYDQDGDADLYLVHDDFEPNFLYQNDGKGHFTEVGEQAGVNMVSYGMGVDVGDVNNDGWLDIYITNLFKNMLLLNNGDGTFSDISKSAQIEDFGMGWGTTFLDFDNDGQLDLYIANDSQFSPSISNTLYHNLGDANFEEVATTEEISNWAESYGTACFDYNLDGKSDVLVANKGGIGVQLFENQLENDNWISFKLIGVESNRMAVGSKIELIDELGITHYKELTAGHGWTSQNSQLLHFGLGETEGFEQVKIHWASGRIQETALEKLNQFYTIVEGQIPMEGIHFPIISSTEKIATTSMKIKLAPNPTSDMLQIELPKNNEGQLSIFDTKGQLIRAFLATQSNIEINTNGWQNGFYILQFKAGNRVHYERFLKQ